MASKCIPVVAVLGMAILLTVSADGASSSGVKGSSGRAIHLELKDSGRTVDAAVGDRILISLAAKPSTGQAWSVDSPRQSEVLKLSSQKYLSASQMFAEMQPMPGEGGTTTFLYQVTQPGKDRIQLVYTRSADDAAAPSKEFAVTVVAVKKRDGPFVTGKLVFKEPPVLNRVTRVVVQIRNTALADGPAPLVGEVEIRQPRSLPITFAVPYDPARVHPNPMFYSISARVYNGEKLSYINDTRHAVLAEPRDTQRDIEVRPVR